MAASEDQPQHVVIEHRIVAGFASVGRGEFDFAQQLLLLAAKRDLAADAVDRLVAPDIDQPCARIGGRLPGRPVLECDRERILQGVLGEIEIADQADQRRQRATRLVAKYGFDVAGRHLRSQL